MALSPYAIGRTALFASQVDQRFSYCLYIPRSFHEEAENTYPLAVIMHGSLRDAQAYRDRFIDWAEEAQTVLLAPLFPGGIIVPGDVSNYRFLEWHGIRFDHVLLAMIDEVAPIYRIRAERFLLHGFSAGGHFAHRFFYLHPRRLAGVSIGAPGMVTLLDEEHDFWVGVRDLEARFGIPLDTPAMHHVPVQMVVGHDDTETWEIAIPPGHERWMPGADLAGSSRVERITALREGFERNGIAVQLDVVPGVAHSHAGVVDAVEAFFRAAKDPHPGSRTIRLSDPGPHVDIQPPASTIWRSGSMRPRARARDHETCGRGSSARSWLCPRPG